jgi:hypothetical protein
VCWWTRAVAAGHRTPPKQSQYLFFFFNLIYFVLLCLQAMDAGHTFRSVIAHSICASIEGNHHSQSLCHIHALPILSFFFLAFRTIRLCCTPSSLWGQWRSKTDQCRPSEPFAPAFELDNGSMRPSHSPYTPQLQLFVWPHVILVGVGRQRRCPTVTSLRLDPRLHFARRVRTRHSATTRGGGRRRRRWSGCDKQRGSAAVE